MDQPTNPPPLNSPEHIIGYIFVAVMGLVGGFFRGKFRMRREHAKAQDSIAIASAAAEPSIQKENIEWSEGLIDRWKDDLKAAREEFAAFRREAREEIARERDRAEAERQRAEDWQTRAMSCESQNQLKDFKIARLEERVTELERQVSEARGRREDVR